MIFTLFFKSDQKSDNNLRKCLFTVLLHFVTFITIDSFTPTNVPSKHEIKIWAEKLEDRLSIQLESISGTKVLEESYIINHTSDATFVSLDGLGLAKTMAKALNKNFEKKKQALKRLVDKAEEIVKDYVYQPTLPVIEGSWKNVKNLSEYPGALAYSSKFKRDINESYSGVHVPLEIFEGSPEILNGLNWSAKLDDTFKENLANDDTLLWQYFGSQAGFMRQYPASQWKTLNNFPDLYDVRRRPWYIHGSSSPKDMLILMDTSGSMHGQTMEIMKNAVKNILDTLGEDDFVNVAKFSNETKWVSCFEKFVQATWRNKYTLIKDIDNLKDAQMASLSRGLHFAFEQFNNFQDYRLKENKHWVGADCNRIIVIFTDGGTEEVGDAIKKWNRDKRIRIFTFAVGPHPVPYATLKAVACKNKGFFSAIPSMGATRTRVQILDLLSRPMVLTGEKEYQWTNFYKDVYGLGILTTVTLPVFNKSAASLNQSMVGVIGVDITVQELVDEGPYYKLGPGGYTFALNHNGLVVFHPDLPTEVNRPPMPSQITAFYDSPHVDFLEVETENPQRTRLRRAMIDHESGYVLIDGIIKMPDMIHIVPHSLQYFYTPVVNTPFSLALVANENHSHFIDVQKDMSKGLDIDLGLSELTNLIIAPWKYCNKTIVLNIEEFSRVMKLHQESCNKLLVKRVMWDIERTRPLIKYWMNSRNRKNVVYTFVTSEGGLSRVYPYEEIESFKDQNYSDPRISLAYKRAVFANGWVLLVPNITHGEFHNETRTTIPFVKMLNLNYPKRSIPYKPAAIGGVVTSDFLKDLLMNTPDNSERHKFHCGNTDGPRQVLCYLIDDGGYVILTNQKDDDTVPGQFLGKVDSELMEALFNESVFKRLVEYDHEELCPKGKKVNAGFSAHSINPLKFLFQLFSSSQFSNFFWNFYHFITSFTLWSPRQVYGDPINFDEIEVCSKILARYYITTPQNREGNIICEDKGQRIVRNYSLATLGGDFGTNLMLIVTTPQTHCHVPEPVQQPRRVDQIDICHPEVRYRRRPGKCFANHTSENTQDCGKGNVIIFSIFLISVEFAIILISWSWYS